MQTWSTTAYLNVLPEGAWADVLGDDSLSRQRVALEPYQAAWLTEGGR